MPTFQNEVSNRMFRRLWVPTMGPIPAYDHDYRSGVLGPGTTFTRASSGTFFDSTGTLQTAAVDVPRFSFDPITLSSRGLLVENQKTKYIRNNSFSGVSGVKTGSGTVTGNVPDNCEINVASGVTVVVSTGTEAGMPYYELAVSGTPATSPAVQFYFENGTGIPAATGDNWTLSARIKRTAGDFTNINVIRLRQEELNSGGSAVATSPIVDIKGDIDGTFKRFSAPYTFVGGATVTNLRPALTVSVALAPISFTLRVYAPQAEKDLFASSEIISSGNVTRALDQVSVSNLSNIGWNATEGTVVVEFERDHVSSAGTYMNALRIDDGGFTTNSLQIYCVPSSQTMSVKATASSVVLFDTPISGTFSLTAPNKIAYSFKSGSYAACLNGATVYSNASTGFPSGLSTMFIGSDRGGSAFDGWIRRVTYYSNAVSNTQLQALTA